MEAFVGILHRSPNRAARVVDLGSTNGVVVNGVRVQEAELKPNSTMQLGETTLRVDAGDQVEQGAPLGKVESPELTNLLKQEESSLQSLKFELDRNKIQAKKQKLENQKIIDLATVSLNAADREKRRADEGYAKNNFSSNLIC